MEQIFLQLALILSSAFIIAYIVRLFNQPIVIGYIIAGVITAFIIQAGLVNLSINMGLIHAFSKFGIAFLLFIVGIHLNPKIIKEIGLASLSIGIAQVILTFGIAYFTSLKVLGFNAITSTYLGLALAFSSTIIVMKLLSDKGQLESLYGKISTGILIIQDLIVIFALLFVSSITGGENWSSYVLKNILGGTGLIIILFLVGIFIFPKLMKSVAKSQELLFLFAIWWCFVIATLFDFIGFSIEIGALIGGMILSTSKYSPEISARIKPLRDFFLIIFFIILGLNLNVSNIHAVLMNALVFSLITLTAKPIITMGLMALAGYTKRTNFLVGTTLSQISEFSIILIGVGVSMGHLSPDILNSIILTLVITVLLSTYMIIFSNYFYKKIYWFASFFERAKIKKENRIEKKYDAILFGYNRIGFSILKALRKIKKKYVIIDYNPDTISALSHLRIPCLYGDADDPDLLRDLPLDKIEIAVSTIPDFETNLLVIDSIKMVNPNAIIIVRAHQVENALELYQKGANYVLTPHFLGGEYVSSMIRHIKNKTKGYEEEKRKHIKMLEEIKKRGLKHPEVEK